MTWLVIPILLSILVVTVQSGPLDVETAHKQTMDAFLDKFWDKESTSINWTKTMYPQTERDWNIVCTYLKNSNTPNHFPEGIEDFQQSFSIRELYLSDDNHTVLQVEVIACEKPDQLNKEPIYATAKLSTNELTKLEKEYGGMIIKVEKKNAWSNKDSSSDMMDEYKSMPTLDQYMKEFVYVYGADKREAALLPNRIPSISYSTLCTQGLVDDQSYSEYIRVDKKQQIIVEGSEYVANILTCTHYSIPDLNKNLIGVIVEDQLELLELHKNKNKLKNTTTTFYSVKCKVESKRGSPSKSGCTTSEKQLISLLAKSLEKSKINGEETYNWLDHSPIPDYAMIKICPRKNISSGMIQNATTDFKPLILMPYGENRDVQIIDCEYSDLEHFHIISIDKKNKKFIHLKNIDGKYFIEGKYSKERIEKDDEFYNEYMTEVQENGVVNWSKDGLPIEILDYKCHESLNQNEGLEARSYYHFFHMDESDIDLGDGKMIKVDVIQCDSDYKDLFEGVLNPYNQNILTPITSDGEAVLFKDGKLFTYETLTDKFTKQFNGNKEEEKTNLITLSNFTTTMKTKCAKFKGYPNTNNVKDVEMHIQKLVLQPYHNKNIWSEILECKYKDPNKDPNIESIFPIFDTDILSLVRPMKEELSNYELYIPQIENPEDLSDLKLFEGY